MKSFFVSYEILEWYFVVVIPFILTSEMCELLRELANESGKHKGKREKRQQKASFRDILKSVEVGPMEIWCVYKGNWENIAAEEEGKACIYCKN